MLNKSTKKPKTPPPLAIVNKIGSRLEDEGLAYRPTRPPGLGTSPSKVEEIYEDLSAQGIVTKKDRPNTGFPSSKKPKKDRGTGYSQKKKKR